MEERIKPTGTAQTEFDEWVQDGLNKAQEIIYHLNLERKYKTGYYIIGEEELQKVINKNYIEPIPEKSDEEIYNYHTADIFLNGACHLFALALNKKYGYSALNLQNKLTKDAHYFCKSRYKNQDVYIDVRGITTDLQSVICGFVDENYNLVSYNFENEKILSEADRFGLEFAEQIINDNPEFYDVNAL